MDAVPEALVFDFDGVIADTERLYWRAWSESLGVFNVPFTWEDYCRIGRGIREEKMLVSLAEMVRDPAVVAHIKSKSGDRKERVRGWCADQTPIAASTVQLLQSLQGHRLGLVTSSNRDDVEGMLLAAGIADCFEACVFGGEVTSHKPDPAPYLLLRKKLGISAGVAFEDSEPGLASASGAGFRAIRVISPEDLPALVAKYLNSGV